MGVEAEKAVTEGLTKPSDLSEASALNNKVLVFDKNAVKFLTVLVAANDAALKARYDAVKAISDDWVKKVDILFKEWTLLDKTTEGENQFSLEKMESTLGELKNIFKEKEKLV